MDATYWPRLADEAAYILDLLLCNPDRNDTDLLIVALGRIEHILNPRRLPFSDRRRNDHGGDSELCRGWRRIRATVDSLLAALELRPVCEGHGVSWSVAGESELPSLPSPVPQDWIISLAHGVRIIRQRLPANGSGVNLVSARAGGKGNGRRSRGQLAIYDAAKDVKLETDWKSAKSLGSKQKEFCDARGIKVKELTAALTRNRERRNRPKGVDGKGQKGRRRKSRVK